ncbi:unnamed protein product [Sphagnum jensenii]|uniref:TFIIS N-terminal domain-containing protein n=1 Tax=Sphagnum jensenii TaxID=128206 RepID=A0ABP1ADU0_9BRYO
MKYDKIATILDKDGGLLNVGVVEHLVQLMRNDLLQDGGMKVADVVAHHTMLAGVIAATENSECLNQFVHLGGLCSLDDWLQEVRKGKIGGDGGSLKECDKVVEDLLLALLRALDRLPVDLKALKTCYVGKSVNHLRSHKNVDIQKKARKLVDVWKKRVDAEMNASTAEVGGMGSRTGTLERVSAEGETMKGEQQQQNGIMSVDVRLSRVNDCFSQYMAMEMGEALQSKDHSEAGVTHSALNHEIPSTKGSRGGGKVEPKEQHDGGSIERQGSVSPSDANREADSLSVEQRGGGGERTEKKLSVQEGAGQACEASSNTPSTLMSMVEPAVEKRRAIEASAKASVEHPFLKEFNASVMMNDLESKVSSSKFGKRDFVSDERKSPRTQSKDISTTRDICSGVEEDVLEVARQAANEIEQMQENSKPVSSSSSERDDQNAQTAGSPTGGEMKDVTTTDTASKGQQQGSLTDAGDDKVKSSSNAQDQRDVMRALAAHVNGVEKFDRVEEVVAAKIVQAACPVDAPIAVLAATKGAFIPPTSPMWIKGELGWKGSAATSAFRPAEPRRTPDRQHSGAESLASDANLSLNANPVKRPRPLLEFDLNVADDRVMEDIGVAVTTLSSQGSVLEIGYGRTTRPNLDLDLNRMDDSEECRMMPFSSDARVAEGVGSLAPSNNSTSKPPARRVMDFDLNDGPSFEEVGVDEPTTLQSLPARKLAGNAPMPVPMSGLRMEGGEAMNFSPWFTPTGNPFAGVSSIPAFAPGRVPDPGYAVPPAAAAAAAANSFLNAGSTAATAMSPFNGEIFRGGPTLSGSPAVVYPPPGERVAFGAHGPFPVFGGSPGYLPSSVPFSGSFMDVSGGPVPFPSQFGGQPTVNSSTYIRPPLLMGMTEAVVAADNSGGTWSRRSLDLNAGPEVIDTDIARDDVMHGRLPLLHPGNSAAFNDQMRVKLAQVSGNASLTTPLKRKEPEGGWNCYTGSGGYKQSTWR